MKRQLGIYIHIPFCVKKCSYCDFISMHAGSELIESYINALLQEIKRYKHMTGGYEAATIFFGGGTPSLINAGHIVNILDEVIKIFKPSAAAEITIECNPGTLTEQKLRAYRDAGINRLSIGLQSAINSELTLLGRMHDYDVFYENFESARKAGFNNINIDIISALPGQTYESWLTTIRTAAALNPEHISAYSLIIEEGTHFHKLYDKDNNTINNMPLPSEDEERRMYKATKELLKNEGYKRYEISNYAKEGYECRHNCFYWNRTEYIGLGLSAASFFMDERYVNTSSIDEYIKYAEDNNYIRNSLKISRKDAMEEFMYLGLRMSEGVSSEEFYKQFGENIFKIYGDVINKMIKLRLISIDNDRIILTEKGIDVSNHVLCEFLL